MMTKPVSEMSPEEYERHRKGRENRRKLKQAEILERYGYSCESCGITEMRLGFFEFHHTDPKTKEREIGSMLNSASIEKINKELEKCVMLCPNCHKKEHLSEGMTLSEIRKNANELSRKQ